MARINSTMTAEIGTWQDYPPQSGFAPGAHHAWPAHYGAWVSLSRQRRALAELDEHLLRDIGLTAYDVTREATARDRSGGKPVTCHCGFFLFGFALAACSAMKRGSAKAATCTSGDQYLVLNLPALA